MSTGTLAAATNTGERGVNLDAGQGNGGEDRGVGVCSGT